MIPLIAIALAQLSTPLNLNGQAIYRASCDGGITCAKSGQTLTIIGSGAAGGGGAGGAPVDGGYVVWTSVGSTNERLLSNGTNTTIDTATPGQIQVDLSGTIAQSLGGTGTGALTCAAGERLTSNGTVYSCSALPAGGSANVVEVEVDFGAAGNDTASTVVTGQAWVTGTSKIVCSPTMLGTTDRAEGVEDVLLEDIDVAIHTRVVSTGFTLTVHAGQGLARGKFIFHCTGV